MKLKGYTSEVPPAQSIAAIERLLIASGVSGIAKQYGPGGIVTAIMFEIDFGGGQRNAVRLPAKTKEATDAFWRDYELKHPKSYKRTKKREDFVQQGERTAWRLVLNWIEVQLSMVQLNQADFREVFLAYLWTGKETFYEQLRQGGFKALPERTEQAP